MADATTKIGNLIDPGVMADVISAKLPNKLKVAPFAKVDTTLQGVPGDTITVSTYGYIGDADDVAEGVAVEVDAMSATSKRVAVKKAMKGVSLTDEAVLSGYGNPVGEANGQLIKALAAKLDADCMAELQKATLTYDGSAAQIGYTGIVSAIDVFGEEVNTPKVLFVHPKQVTQLRKDANFLSADAYQGGVAVTGEVGIIANTRIVASSRVPQDAEKENYLCPLVQLEAEDDEDGDGLPALTIYLKRSANVEIQRLARSRVTEITADQFYAAALSNEAKVVLAKFKA